MKGIFRVLITGRDHLLVRMEGPINEHADFTPVKFAKRPPIEIDMSEVTLINSVGIRAFADWSAQLQNEVIELSHVPKFFVDQINMIPGLIPARAKVISFYVPFFCPENEKEKRVLYRRGLEFDVKGGEVKLSHPTVTDEEKHPYELDVVPVKFFSFLEDFG